MPRRPKNLIRTAQRHVALEPPIATFRVPRSRDPEADPPPCTRLTVFYGKIGNAVEVTFISLHNSVAETDKP